MNHLPDTKQLPLENAPSLSKEGACPRQPRQPWSLPSPPASFPALPPIRRERQQQGVAASRPRSGGAQRLSMASSRNWRVALSDQLRQLCAFSLDHRLGPLIGGNTPRHRPRRACLLNTVPRAIVVLRPARGSSAQVERQAEIAWRLAEMVGGQDGRGLARDLSLGRVLPNRSAARCAVLGQKGHASSLLGYLCNCLAKDTTSEHWLASTPPPSHPTPIRAGLSLPFPFPAMFSCFPHTSEQRVAGWPGLPKKPRLARQSVTCGESAGMGRGMEVGVNCWAGGAGTGVGLLFAIVQASLLRLSTGWE